jgi:hypothetical protein
MITKDELEARQTEVDQEQRRLESARREIAAAERAVAYHAEKAQMAAIISEQGYIWANDPYTSGSIVGLSLYSDVLVDADYTLEIRTAHGTIAHEVGIAPKDLIALRDALIAQFPVGE